MTTTAPKSCKEPNTMPKSAIIETFTGEAFDLCQPLASSVHTIDIAHALSNLCRYTGHTSHFYSVAEHSINVARWMARHGGTDHEALLGLLHDAHEAYVGDLNSPLKHILPEYSEIADNIQAAIETHFGLDRPNGYEATFIKAADLHFLKAEAKTLLPDNPDVWTPIFKLHTPKLETTESPLPPATITGLQPVVAEQTFILTLTRLVEHLDYANLKL